MEGENRRTLEGRENIVEVETQNARYDIIYGIHQLEQSPEVVGNSDGLIIEGVGDFSTPDKVKVFLEQISRIPQHRRLIEYCRRNQKDLYLTDLNGLVLVYEQRASLQIMTETVGGSVFGAWAAADCLHDYFDEKLSRATGEISRGTMNRRGFLKKAGTITKAVSSAYLMTPMVGDMVARLSGQPKEGSVIREIDRDLMATNEAIHPEIYGKIISFRNHLIAQKAEYVAQKIHEGGVPKPKLSILIGAGHTGIESALEKSVDQRMAVIKEEVMEDGRLKQPTIVKISFNGDDVAVTFLEEENIKKIN